MSRSPGRLRAKALLLLLVLLVGGFGLPIVDAMWFHSTSGASVSTEKCIAAAPESATSHLLGCAVWSSPVASTGLPVLPPTPAVTTARAAEPQSASPAVFSTQFARTLALPRAPPPA
jgi:hypothetical protein